MDKKKPKREQPHTAVLHESLSMDENVAIVVFCVCSNSSRRADLDTAVDMRFAWHKRGVNNARGGASRQATA